MAGLIIQLKREVLYACGAILIINLLNTLSVCAHGIVRAGNHEYRQVFGRADKSRLRAAFFNYAEKPHKAAACESEAALFVRNVSLYILLVFGEPLIARPGGFEFYIISAEREFGNKLALVFPSVYSAYDFCYKLGKKERARARKTRTHNYRAGKFPAVARYVFAAEKGAHAVSHDKAWHARSYCPYAGSQFRDILQNKLLPVLGKVAEVAVRGAAVAEVILRANEHPSLRRHLRKL